MSNSVRPHRQQPTRLCHPWDSPGKNTGVGCHFLLQCMKVKVKSFSCVRLFSTPWTVAYQDPPSMGFSRQEYRSGVPLPSLPLDSKEIKPVNLKGDQPWIFTGRWRSSIFLVWCRETTHWKSRWCWERLRAEGKEGNKGWDGWTASPMQWTWTLANSRRWWGTGKSGVLQSTGSQRVRYDRATEQQQTLHMSYPDGASSKESSGQCRRHRRHRFDPGAGRSPGGGNGNPLQYACLENFRDRGAWWAEYTHTQTLHI